MLDYARMGHQRQRSSVDLVDYDQAFYGVFRRLELLQSPSVSIGPVACQVWTDGQSYLHPFLGMFRTLRTSAFETRLTVRYVYNSKNVSALN